MFTALFYYITLNYFPQIHGGTTYNMIIVALLSLDSTIGITIFKLFFSHIFRKEKMKARSQLNAYRKSQLLFLKNHNMEHSNIWGEYNYIYKYIIQKLRAKTFFYGRKIVTIKS